MTPFRLSLFGLCLLFLAGCSSTPHPPSVKARPFDFASDTFAFNNELKWVYEVDEETGKMTTRDREPDPEYAQHCFVVARAARQFYEFAAFDPNRPPADRSAYRSLIHEVTGASLRTRKPRDPIIFPGYENLRAFSADWEQLLKDEMGGSWQSYFQRGHWRMIFPFSRSHQEETAGELQQQIDNQHPPVAHIVRFPQLTINHAILLTGYRAVEEGIEFEVYDPNFSEEPTVLVFRENDRTFYFPASEYFIGGRVDVYPVYDRWFY